MNHRLRALTIGAWLTTLMLCGTVIINTRFIADLSAFMPKLPSERQQLLVDQLRDGIVARLIMIGIEGGSAIERANVSRDLAVELRSDAAFVYVQNGDTKTRDLDRKYFFDNRYLLSPAITADRFTANGMRKAIGNSIDALSGDAGLIFKQLLPRDPTGETQQFIEQFAAGSEPRNLDGVWASHDGNRAILLAQIRASGTDTEAQHQAIEAIRKTFGRISGVNAGTRLVMSGTSVFSVSSRNTIEREVKQLAIASTVFVIALLLLVYRSFSLLLLGLLPVLSGAIIGVAAVSLGYGQVHALTLGFGTTLIGEAVDYSIYLFIQRSGDIQAKRFWRTIRLGVITSVSGFSVLLFSGFPGLSQLGLFSISGLVAAALVTRYVLPLLMSERMTLPALPTVSAYLNRLVGKASHARWIVVLLLLVATSSIIYQSGSIWNRRLSALSPISATEQQLDTELRADLGAEDMRYFATFTSPTEEDALRLAERTGRVLAALASKDVIGGFNSPAFVLPSVGLQRERQAMLPQPPELQARLKNALVGLPIRAARLEGFVKDLEAARSRPPLTRSDLAGTSAALLFDSLLVRRDANYLVLMPLRPPVNGASGRAIDLAVVNEALVSADVSKVVLIDLLEETTNLFENYLQEAKFLSGLGFIAIILLLLFSLRSFARMIRVVIPLVCSVLCVVALLLAFGIQLTIFHLIGLLLVVAVGSNYALFFDGGTFSEMESGGSQMQVSLLVANLTTVGSFGILGTSQVPVLNAIGSTVGIGAFLALVFSAILARSWASQPPA